MNIDAKVFKAIYKPLIRKFTQVKNIRIDAIEIQVKLIIY